METEPTAVRNRAIRLLQAGDQALGLSRCDTEMALYLDSNLLHMVNLDLTEDERETLVGVLESYLSDLRMEISDTDSLDFRERLKERKRVLRKVLETLRTSASPTSSGEQKKPL